jgi:hypothetical protein
MRENYEKVTEVMIYIIMSDNMYNILQSMALTLEIKSKSNGHIDWSLVHQSLYVQIKFAK